MCRSLQQLRKVLQRASLPSTPIPQFWTRESCTRCRVTLLIRSLSGKTLMVVSGLDELVSQFRTRLSALTGIPQCHFYLTHQGRVMVDDNTLNRQGCCRGSLICMCSGFQGSGKPPVVPGSWHCHTCNLGVCWPSRNTCFRCLVPRGSSALLPKPRHQRETQALDRAPQRSPAVELTQRRASTSVPGSSAPRVVPPHVLAGNDNGDAQAVLKVLRGLGLGGFTGAGGEKKKTCSLRPRKFPRGKGRWLI